MFDVGALAIARPSSVRAILKMHELFKCPPKGESHVGTALAAGLPQGSKEQPFRLSIIHVKSMGVL
jgi:hypothetical protein